MLRIIPSSNGASAAAYYSEGLKREDYYTADREVVSQWHGLAAQKLGLSGEVEPEHFTALLDNKDPFTGQKLTPRQGAAADRIPGWDFNFHAPKSLSILQGLTGDQKLVEVFRRSVAETMADIEKEMATRVRIKGHQDDRITGNLAWAEFIHHTARPVDGVPDPHLHIHAYVPNLTFDSAEGKWKAAKIRDIKCQAPYFQALFQARVARGIEDLGYPTVRTKAAWEVAGFDRAFIQQYSRRNSEIDKTAEELGITDPKQKAELGAKTRKGKRHDLTAAQLKEEWKSRLSPEQRTRLQAIVEMRHVGPSARLTPSEIVDFAERKLFEKNSVVRLNDFLAEALRYGVGQTSMAEIQQELARRGMVLRNLEGASLLTTIPNIIEEVQLVQRVREGLGTQAPLIGGRLHFSRSFLSKEQREAVRHILKSNDQVIALRGKAGAGKTTLLSEVKEQIETQGQRLFAFAPSAEASRKVLRDENFEGAETIAHFLQNKKLQERCRGQVILIDEAGTIGIRDLSKVLEVAGSSTRVILSGDVGQHAPVPRADALRLLETFSGMPVAEVRQIRRQEKLEYRKAVEALSEGDLKTAFNRLEAIGAIVEIPGAENRYRQLAADYGQCILETGTAPLVVSPTHLEAKSVTSAIREYLQKNGQLGPERSFLQYRLLQLTEAEKEQSENYEPGMAVKFHQNIKGIRRGSVLQVVDIDQNGRVWLQQPDHTRIVLDLANSGKFNIFEIDRIGIASGDSIKITAGGNTNEGKRLNNGATYKVKGFTKDGSLLLTNGMKINHDFGHLAHGYCHTSHSSQGKTVKSVFIAHSASSGLASSREGLYVSVSRGKRDLRIYTDDRVGLQKAVGNSSRRLSALELTGLGKEIFLSGGMSGDEWTKRIAAERGYRHDKNASHVENLQHQRKLEPQQKIKSFRAYIEMQRKKSGPDGKSRSKSGGYSPPKQQRGQKGICLPKRIEMRESLVRKVTAPTKGVGEVQTKVAKKSKLPSVKKTRINSVKAAFQNTRNNIAASMERAERKPDAPRKTDNAAHNRSPNKSGAVPAKPSERRINFGNLKTTFGKLSNAKNQSARIEKKAVQPAPPKPKPKPPAPKPPAPKPPTPPPPRRGR